MIRRTISLSERADEMAREIMEAKGYATFGAVIHQAIIELHRSYFPAYVRPRADTTPEGRVLQKMHEKKIKEQAAAEELIKVCDALEGTVVESKSGGKVCRYFTYNFAKRYEQEIPLNLLTPDLTKTQYQPSRQKVEELQKSGKANYKNGK